MIKRTFIALVLLVIFFSPLRNAFAEAPDFIVGPAKNEITLNAGESKNASVLIINRLGVDTSFSITASKLIADEEGNLVPSNDSVSEKISFPKEISLKSGEQKVVEIFITSGKDSEPGSSAFGIFVEPKKEVEGQIGARSRVGVINIVRTNGEVIESGSFTNIKISDDKKVRMDGDVPVSISFENSGTVHLNPYGILVVKNIFGKEVSAQKIDPWYVMPESSRTRNLNISNNNFFGRYTASVVLNRGYQDLVETKEVAFYVFPFWFPMVLVFALIAAIFLLGKKGMFRGAVTCALILAGVVNVHAQMSSGNYKVQFDSVNFGGGLSSSTSYTQESTFGEIATGESSSANYNLHAGYQQMNEVFISISQAADATLTPDIGSISGGVSTGSTNVTVTTDGAAGYALYAKASTSPALDSGTDNFADYTPAGVDPDLSFATLAASSFFGFSPEGVSVAARFLDDGAACATGALDTADTCWDGFSLSDKIISENFGSNTPSGTDTALKLRAEAGVDRNQSAGSYVADITLTAFAK